MKRIVARLMRRFRRLFARVISAREMEFGVVQLMSNGEQVFVTPGGKKRNLWDECYDTRIEWQIHTPHGKWISPEWYHDEVIRALGDMQYEITSIDLLNHFIFVRSADRTTRNTLRNGE